MNGTHDKGEGASGNKTDREGHNWRTARQVVRELSALEIDKPTGQVGAGYMMHV